MPAKSPALPASWKTALGPELEKPYFKELQAFVAKEREKHQVFPPEGEVFSAFEYTPFEKTNVFLLGQDPYHDDGQAHGLCFSVKPGVRTPPSLVNMYKELKADLGVDIPTTGYLESWARQGILMLNAVLTVRAHEPNSHKDHGWEQFTDAVIKTVNAKQDQVVFVLWGAYARKKGKLIDRDRHVVVEGAHPSPLSAKQWFGSRPFSKINDALKKAKKPVIDWSIKA